MRLIIFALITVVIGACGGSASQEASTAIDSSQAKPEVESSPAQSKRIYLEGASEIDFDPYIMDHEGSDKLVICHVPPGKPLNFKTKMVGPSSVIAHLNHGSKALQKSRGGNSGKHPGKRPASKIYRGEDYLGPCGTPEPLPDIIVLDDPVFDTDGIVCQGLRYQALYACLSEYDQHITIEL